MSERKNLTITQVKEIEKVGKDNIPKLSFKAKDGDTEHWYQTFRSSLFDAIKQGETVSADVEVKTREYEGKEYTDRRVTQIYVDGQPIGGRKQGQYRGKSPEELELSAKSYALSYAKDLAVAGVIPLDSITNQADVFHSWLKGNGKPQPSESTETKTEAPQGNALTEEQTNWLKESLEELNWPDVSKHIRAHYKNARGSKIKELVESLSPEQQQEFFKEIETRLDIQQAGEPEH